MDKKQKGNEGISPEPIREIRSFRLPGVLWEAAVAEAKKEGTTLTAVVEKALLKYLKKREA